MVRPCPHARVVIDRSALLFWRLQWGFTALHYATVARSKDLVLYLLANGASAIMTSTVLAL
jgi:ankyrin repeat protein